MKFENIGSDSIQGVQDTSIDFITIEVTKDDIRRLNEVYQAMRNCELIEEVVIDADMLHVQMEEDDDNFVPCVERKYPHFGMEHPQFKISGSQVYYTACGKYDGSIRLKTPIHIELDAKPSDKVIIVATTTDGGELDQEVFYSNHKASKYIYEQTGFETKPDVDQDPEEYVGMYYSFVREENDNMCKVDVSVTIINAID